MSENGIRRFLINIAVFTAVMILTFWFVFRNQDISQTADAVRKMPGAYLAAAFLLAVLFVSAEGVMIWYLLKGVGERAGMFRCIAYSFIGFFFSGLTPSATGGQPMQLYYMKRDGNSLSASSVVLMSVAVVYKLVLVLTGIGILLLERSPEGLSAEILRALFFRPFFEYRAGGDPFAGDVLAGSHPVPFFPSGQILSETADLETVWGTAGEDGKLPLRVSENGVLF